MGSTSLRDGVLIYALVGAAKHAAAFATIAVLTRSVSGEIFGLYVLVRIGLTLSNAVTAVGTGKAVVRFAPSRDDASERGVVVGSFLAFRVAVAVVAALIATVALPLAIEETLLEDVTLPLLLSGVMYMLADAGSEALRALERHRANSMVWGAGIVAQLVAIVALVGYLDGGIPSIVVCFVIGDGAMVVVAAGFLYSERARPSWHWIRRLVAFGAPAAVPRWARAVGSLDRFVIAGLATLAAAGQYQIAAMWAAAIGWAEGAAVLAFEPHIYGAGEQRSGPLLRAFSIRFALIVFGIGTSVTLITPELLLAIGLRANDEAIELVPWLMGTAAAHATFAIAGTAVGVTRRTRVWAVSGALELTVAGVLLFVVVPEYGALGAGVVRFGIASAALILMVYWIRRMWAHQLPIVTILLPVPLSVAIGLAAVTSWLGPPWPLFVRAPVAFVIATLVAGGVWNAQRARRKNT